MENFYPTSIPGLLTKKLLTYPDFRGEFVKLPLNNYKEEDVSISTKNVLRGIHYVTKYNRIFTPIYGRVYVVFADMRDGDNKFTWVSKTIDGSNRMSFLIPPFVGCAHLTLSDMSIINYKLEEVYDESLQRTVKYDDPFLNIYWPGDSSNYILSERDHFCSESMISKNEI